MTQAAHNQPPDDDVRDAVSASGKTPWYSDPKWFVPYPMPLTRNRFVLIFWISRCLSWGITTALYKIIAAVKKHPWVAALGVGGAVAMCPVCVYSTGIIVGGMAVWAVKSETDAQSDEHEEEHAPHVIDKSAGEFMQ